MSEELSSRSQRFGPTADVYDRARPGYPAEAVAWLVGSPMPRTVLELGSGTGHLTRSLVAEGHQVIATDPSAQMLDLLSKNVPGVRPLRAAAEAIPLPDHCVDVVAAGQSFHLFDAPRALDEVARVLRPGGQLALIWNIRDEGIPWVRRFGRLVAPGTARPDDVSAVTGHPGFADHQHREFRNWQDLGRDGLIDLARSDSAVAALEAPRLDAVLQQVGALYDEYERGPDGMRLPYQTHCHLAVVDHLTAPSAPPQRVETDVAAPAVPPQAGPAEDPGITLISFD